MSVLIGILLAATLWTDSLMLEAYRQEDMHVWREYVDSRELRDESGETDLLYEYGYCGYIVAESKAGRAESEEAKRYVRLFDRDVEALKEQLSAGHYAMYKSAVYVYELRLHESVHPLKAMSLAKDATRLAPTDPLTLSYYATCLFYAPKPIGSKREALEWFEKAQRYFEGESWRYCWIREATDMYIEQCKEKLNKEQK